MSFQNSIIPFGSSAAVIAGYAYSTSRLGNVDLLIENVGDNTLTMQVSQFVSGSPASSYAIIVPWFTVVPKGATSKSLVISGAIPPGPQIAFFGSGNTTANISFAFRNPADLRGVEINIMPIGKFGWQYDLGNPTAATEPNWPSLPNDGP